MRGTRRPQPGLLFPSPCLSGDARKPLCLPPRITDVREPSERKPCGEAAGRTGVRSRGRTAGALSPTCLRPARPLRVPAPAGSAGSSAPGTHSARSLLSPQTLASSPVSHPSPAGTHLPTNARLQTATRPPSGLRSPPLPTGALTTRLPPAPSPHREGSPDPSPLHPRRRPPPLAMGTPREATPLVTETPRETATPGDGDPEGGHPPW